MAVTSNISVLLKYYATKQNSPFVIYKDFCDYVKRYAQHNVEELPALVTFLGNPENAIEKELIPLVETKQVAIIEQDPTKKQIFVTGFFNAKFAERYKEIQSNPAIPFPTVADFPKQTPLEVLNKQDCQDIIFKLMDSQDNNDKQLYSIIIPNNVPPVIFPGNIPISILVDAVMAKIRRMLKKDEYHDYYLKKLRIANPNKEMTSKNFFTDFVKHPDVAMRSLESAGDSFYFWNQLCYFIKQDYAKIKDFTQEDINVLQSVYIAEIVISYYKNKAQKKLQQETAIKTLQTNLTKPPYYFTMETILKFTDTKGIPLYGQYSEQDLKDFLQRETTESEKQNLPKLLVFKVQNGSRYFVYKNNVISLILRLASDAHITIEEKLTKEWYGQLCNFEKHPEMTDENAFNKKLEEETAIESPILYALLNANFLPILNLEIKEKSNAITQGNLFNGDKLMPYDSILQLSRNTILENAKIMLPVWYTIPIVSWIIALFTKQKKRNSKKSLQKNNQKQNISSSIEIEEEQPKTTKKAISKKDALIKAAKEVEQAFVPEGSTLENELASTRKQWNKMITKQANNNLTEDVNSLIRDYMRKVLRTLPIKSFTPERIHELAVTLVETPNMQKITEHDALLEYTQLYIVYLVKNM